MNKKFIYFFVGALLLGLVFVAFRVTQASPDIPNPGHALSCHTVTDFIVPGGGVSVECDYGIRTGGGCNAGNIISGARQLNMPTATNGWSCTYPTNEYINVFAICCVAI